MNPLSSSKDLQHQPTRYTFHNDSPEYNFGKILKISRMLKMLSTDQCMEWLINCYLPIINSTCATDSLSKPITLHRIILEFLLLHHSKIQNSITNRQLNLLTNFEPKTINANSKSTKTQNENQEEEKEQQTTTKNIGVNLKTGQSRKKERLYLMPSSNLSNVISNFSNNNNNNLFYQIPESVISHNICPFLSFKEIVKSFSNVCLLFSICCENGNVVKTLFINKSGHDELLHTRTNYTYSSFGFKRNDDDEQGRCKTGNNTIHLHKCRKMEKLVINTDWNKFGLRSFWEKYIQSFCNLKYFKVNPNWQFSSSGRRYTPIMPRETKQQLCHFTGTIIVGHTNINAFGEWDSSNKHDITAISDMIGFRGANSNLRELNLNVILRVQNKYYDVHMPNHDQQVTAVSTLHNFFHQQLLLSNILSNLRHFYMTIGAVTGSHIPHGVGSMNALQEKQETQELIKQITKHLMFNLRSKQKQKSTGGLNGNKDVFQIESFGCDVRMGVDYESRIPGEIMYLERVCVLILNKFGWLMRSLHFKTQTMAVDSANDVVQFSGIIKDWQFLKNNKNENKNIDINININNNSEAIPSNLEEICISDYKHEAYKKLIENVLNTSNNIEKFSMLQINKSQFKDIVDLLTNCCDLMIESINNQRLNQIILNKIYIEIFKNDMSYRDRRLESLIQFFQRLCDGIENNRNYNCKPFIVKVHLKGGQDNLLRHFTENRQEFVSDNKTVILNFVDDCFKVVSKLMQKMNQLLFVIEFDGGLLRTFNDNFSIIVLHEAIKGTFECKAKLDEAKFRSNIDLPFTKSHSNGLRMVFESKDYQHNGGFGGPRTRLYCCPNCDKDFEYK